MDNILEVKHLKKYFNASGGQLHAVDDVSFTIERGKTLGVVGESGCGKSTLGRTIIHLYEPTSGEILFNGKDISHVNRSEVKTLREDIQMIFQDPFASLNPRMSVGQLIAEPLLIYNKLKGRDLDRRVAELMDTVGLARRLSNSYPHELDGGRCQRIGVARALALNPKFIVCDEPVSSLDVSIQAQVINQIKYLFLDRNIQSRRRLIRQKQMRIAGKRDSNYDSLTHSSGKLVREFRMSSALNVYHLHHFRRFN